jgi:hypothetical protein
MMETTPKSRISGGANSRSTSENGRSRLLAMRAHLSLSGRVMNVTASAVTDKRGT